MRAVIRYYLPDAIDFTAVEEDLCLAIFCCEALYGRPRVRHECRYSLDESRQGCAIELLGPSGEAAAQIFTSLCAARFGDEGFAVEHVDRVDRVVKSAEAVA